MRNIIIIIILGLIQLTSCNTDETIVEGAQGYNPVGTQVLFTSANEKMAITRAIVPYMQINRQFVCSMYYHAKNNDSEEKFDVADPNNGGTMIRATLKIEDNLGNAAYETGQFYWQNRLDHAFLALSDNHMAIPEISNSVKYDLTRGNLMTKMTDQPDPIVALSIARPTGSTKEGNRVYLYFKHQFAQVRVNIKSSEDKSTTIGEDQIESVQLLGVSEEATINYHLKADGTVDPPKAKEVILDDYDESLLSENKWGTSFSMFNTETATGFLKSFNSIAFGQLGAIRITWHEGTDTEPGVKHVSTYVVPEENENHVKLQTLASGMKYVYDLELRRGLIAVIRASVEDWQQKEELVYGTEGTITDSTL